MAIDATGRQILVFGGRKENGRRSVELFTLSLDTWTWFAPKLDGGPAPPPREQAAAAFADGRLLIFGGRTNGARLNDLWAFSCASWAWEQLPVQGTVPAPRQGAAACVEDGQLYIMGGSSNFLLDDVHAYSLAQQVRLVVAWLVWCAALLRCSSSGVLGSSLPLGTGTDGFFPPGPQTHRTPPLPPSRSGEQWASKAAVGQRRVPVGTPLQQTVPAACGCMAVPTLWAGRQAACCACSRRQAAQGGGGCC